jgi:pimeloyl-ACP methyl ester carboxylesterase
MRVLLWDRPNTGASDVQFWGESESQMKADVLADLLRELNMAPAILTGGSGGARDAIVTVILHPEVATQLIVWNIVGGFVTTMALAQTFCLPSIMTAYAWGIEGVLEMPEWKVRIDANPRNRQRILSMGRDDFLDLMTHWAYAFVPRAAHTVPGVRDLDVATITVPTVIVRPGERDINHPLQVARDVHTLIRGSQLVDPPWPDGDAMWAEALRAGHDRHFLDWPQLAPLILNVADPGARPSMNECL